LREVDDPGDLNGGDLSKGGRLWQRDELLLILKSTGRCLESEDLVKFVDFLESVMPASKIIKFQGIYEIIRQLDQMMKWELVEKRGSCYKITEAGKQLAEEAEGSIENDEKTRRAWAILRNTLSNLPSTRMNWDLHLNAALKGIKEETKAQGES
jgi:hypothetical protein